MNSLKQRTLRYLRILGIKPRKSLGQNFLICESAYDRILRAIKICHPKTVVEIGPGLGFLAEKILQESWSSRGSLTYVGVELDSRLCAFLKERFSGVKNFNFLNEDFLRVDLANYKDCILVGNIPYHLSGPILHKTARHAAQIKAVCLMLQTELAKRISAICGSKSFGRLSVLCQIFFKITKLANLSKNCFFPPPKVNSTILLFNPIDNSQDIDPNIVQKVTKICFAQKRKTLANNLKKFMHQSFSASEKLVPVIYEFFKQHNMLDLRAEQVSVDIWKNLLSELRSLDVVQNDDLT